MGAKLPDQTKLILVIAEQHQILAHDANRHWRTADRHFLRRRDRLPIGAQKSPAPGSGTGLRDQVVLGLG